MGEKGCRSDEENGRGGVRREGGEGRRAVNKGMIIGPSKPIFINPRSYFTLIRVAMLLNPEPPQLSTQSEERGR